MKQQRLNFKLLAIFLVGLFILLAAYGGYSITVYGTRWFAFSGNTRVREEKSSVIQGDILDRNNVVLATTSDGKRVYQADEKSRRAVVHLLGDNQGYVSNGVESFQASYLLGFHTSLAERIVQATRGETRRGDNVTLTVDSKLCTAIANAFSSGAKTAGKSGAAVVINYKTGEVMALVSLPTFDPHKASEISEDDPLKPFWNRATQSVFPPGSTFKIITMTSALQNLENIQSQTLNCTGNLQVLDQIIHDYNQARHGDLSLKEAFTVSCNNIFASLALKLGDERLRKTAESFGFNDNFLFRDLVVENSTYPTTGRNQVEVAWSGVGQSHVAATPLHMCMVAAAVANNGVMMEPRLIQSIVSSNGVARTSYSSKVYRKSLTESLAATLQESMRAVVTSGTGSGAAVEGLKICGKTGSAESAQNGVDVTHAWFVGFIDNDDLPYAVSVVVEAGGGGGEVASPIARQIFQYLKNNYR